MLTDIEKLIGPWSQDQLDKIEILLDQILIADADVSAVTPRKYYIIWVGFNFK